MPTTKARTWKEALGTPRTSLAVKKSGGKKYVVGNKYLRSAEKI